MFLIPSFLKCQTGAFDESWRWVQFKTGSGLPSDRVFDLVETPGGAIWAATQSGLTRFNGYHWEPSVKPAGVPVGRVVSMAGCPDDSIMIVVDNGLYYGGKTGFRRIPFIRDGKEKEITAAVPYKEGGFLVLSESRLYLVRNDKAEEHRIPGSVMPQKIYDIWSTRADRIWINGESGLYLCGEERWDLKIRASGRPLSVKHLSEDKSGRGILFIVGPRSRYGLWEWDPGTPPHPVQTQGFDNVITLDIGPLGQAVLIKESDNISVRENNKWRTLTAPPRQMQNVLFIKYRADGDLWAGTENGLFLYRSTSARWTGWKYPPPDRRNSINEIIERKDGSVCVASGSGIQPHNSDGEIESIEKIDGADIFSLTGLAEDRDGNLWVSSGSSFEGAYRWDGSKWRHFGRGEGLDAGYIHKIRTDKRGNLWFLGIAGNDAEFGGVRTVPGVYIYSGGKFTEWEKMDSLLSRQVYSFAEGDDGTLWFGTNGGLSRWQPGSLTEARGKWTHWTIRQGLRQNRIFDIAVDRRNKVWFCDQSSGLGYIEKETPGYITVSEGLISNTVWSIEIDEKERMWIGTRSGISIYNNGTWSSMDTDEGLENTRIWPILASKDKIYIGTSGGGVSIFHPAHVNKNLPKVVLYRPMVAAAAVNLHWRVYAFFGEQHQEKIDVRYRIDDEAWSAWNRDRHTIFGNLSPGDHEFKVQVKDFLGNIGTAVQRVSFTIEPPLYRQPRFFLPIGILMTVLLVFGIVFLRRKRKQDNIIRKSEVRYRNLFESANDAIMIFSPEDKTILEVNKKACDVYGFTKEEFVGSSLTLLMKDKDRGAAEIGKILESGGKKIYETVHSKKEGTELNIIANASVIDYDGRTAILSVNRDMTEQVQAEAKIRLLAQTIASAQDFVSITDTKNKILFVNDAFIKAYGYSEDELIGENISVVRSPLTPSEITDKILPSTLAGGWNGELFNRRKDGTDFPIELWSSVVLNEQSEPVAVVGVARDITERKKTEEERENLIIKLKEALTEVKALSGLLPICSSCKKIRDDKGYWTQVETYIAKHSEATFTHGLCPDCLKEYFPQVYQRMKDKDI